ncbi:esterase family protein [Corynebacterium sp. sy017]|uniref:alpha/beta hydrolase n=1 Tax=unclassified Corynebacterium TaxID=2624378 RepID=UPI001185B801|nr:MULTISPECIES: alpha/beta hydrolase family protein [unclassified Corynebacterium]MBP3089353.1 esterase family protein [Corynebacterium sp. sy017]TSD90951.1 esterase family protein [Corynebacterium sp. SY003]
MKITMILTRFFRNTSYALSAALVALIPSTFCAAHTQEQESTPTNALATITQVTVSDPTPQWRNKLDGDRVVEMVASSPAMNGRQIPLVVIKAAQPHRPTIYLLNGADGGEGNANWIAQTDVIDFYRDKNVNVVIPMAGKYSYYTDWLQEVPQLGGKQRWETFLTKELPGAIEKELLANNKRAVVGMSMSALSSLLLAEHNPGFYAASAAFSGCAASASPAAHQLIGITLDQAHATPEQMWGAANSETWKHNDALINAEKLRGTALYVSSASGIIGQAELPGPQENFLEGALERTPLWIAGGGIEAASNVCTHILKAKLDELAIPVTANFRPTGIHSWNYWSADLRDSWPVLKQALEN